MHFLNVLLLFKEQRYLLRHMEREEPQGEENGDPSLHQAHFQHQAAAIAGRLSSSTSSTLHDALAAQQLKMQQLINPGSGGESGGVGNAQAITTRMATPTTTPTYTYRAILDGNPQAAAAAAAGSPRPQEDIWSAAKMSAKLNPSVYSHPGSLDPVLSAKNYFPVLGGKRANVDVTSSGAFFDPKAVNRNRLPQENR
jgi:hypothetical protein